MSITFAISGKGGVGKTTISALLINQLIHLRHTPVLAVDADPNTCLDSMLGVKIKKSVGTVREEAKESAQKGMASGISKQELIEIKISESLVESDDFDLIAMGRPEGAGCYCYANNVLKSVIQTISGNYPYIVIDNEAGLENLSRRIIQKVDVLFMVADPSKLGLNTLARLYELASEMKIEYKKLILIINRLKEDKLPKKTENLLKKINPYKIIGLPENKEIAQLAEEGRSIKYLTDTNPVNLKINDIIEEVL